MRKKTNRTKTVNVTVFMDLPEIEKSFYLFQQTYCNNKVTEKRSKSRQNEKNETIHSYEIACISLLWCSSTLCPLVINNCECARFFLFETKKLLTQEIALVSNSIEYLQICAKTHQQNKIVIENTETETFIILLYFQFTRTAQRNATSTAFATRVPFFYESNKNWTSSNSN